MKKIIAVSLAAMMAASMTVSAFAATELDESPANGKSEGEYTIGVNGKFEAGSNAPEEISADISWEAMEFSYTAGDSSYSPTTHITTYGDGSWSTNKPGITVTNHSNVAIDTTMSFAKGTDVTTKGTFYTKDGDDNYTAITSEDDQGFTLESAENKSVAPYDALYFGVSGAAITEDTTLGTITVKIAKSIWTLVGTADELHNALLAGGSIRLTANVDNVGYLTFQKDTTLDLNGKTLSAIPGYIYNFTGTAEVKNGTVAVGEGSAWYAGVATVKLTDCTVTGGESNKGTFVFLEGDYATLILSGTVNMDYGIAYAEGSTVTCLAGTYNFDPTAYIGEGYTVTDNGSGTYTVSANA